MRNKNENKPLPYLLAHMHSGCCTPWPFSKRRGYGDVYVSGVRIGRAHIMVCAMMNGPKPTASHHARHLCGKGHLGCFNAECLKWGTAKENVDDTRRHGNAPIGERNPFSKLTTDAVIEIRAMRGRVAQPILAEKFGVSQSLISLVQLGKAWMHVEARA